MVTVYGMSETMGPIAFGQKEEAIFLGREIAQHRDYSEQTAIMIDEEVRRIIDEAHKTAKEILREHEDLLHKIAETLVERETLEGKEIARLQSGECRQTADLLGGYDFSETGDLVWGED